MSIIQSIRERGALISAIVIALALLGFILMDAFSGRSNLFSGKNSTTLAVVNGRELDYRKFEEKIKIQEQNAAQRGSTGEAARQQIIGSLWNQEVNRLVMLSEFEKLGLTIGDKELSDVVYNNPLPQFYQAQQFTDPETGQFNLAAYHQYIQYLQANSGKDPLVKQEYDAIIDAVEYTRLTEKYNAMALAASYLPKWFIEKQNTENSGLANISYVEVPYHSINDSTIQVTDKEIEEYIKKHKDRYQQKDSRSIELVAFSAAPSSGDSAAIKNQLESLKQPFKEAQDNESFVAQNFSDLGYYKGHLGKEAIQAPDKDSLVAAGSGNVYGPYVYGSNYVLAKLINSSNWPDTVKVRHILVSTAQRTQQGQMVPVRPDTAAKRIIDSVESAIKGGAIFDSLCIKYSEDPGSKDKGGVYEGVYVGQMTPVFNEFIFSNPVGAKGVVKTEFGYHYIEVLSQKGSAPVYEIAYITKPILASKETDNAAQNAAIKLAGEARDPKAFDEYVKKNLEPQGINKMPATLGPEDYNIIGVGVSRALVRDIYKAHKGEVLQPTRVGDDYVVAVVTDIADEGLQPVSKARPFAEPLLKNEKKAEQIVKNIGVYNTLEEVSAKTGFPVNNEDSIRFTGAKLSQEPKVVGAAFNPEITGRVLTTPIKGNNGVYAVKVNELTATAVALANIEEQRNQHRTQAMQRISGGNYYGGPMTSTPTAVLRKVASIKDKRNDFNY